MLTAERTSFTIALQAEESQDGESGGVSLAHYRSLVAQVWNPFWIDWILLITHLSEFGCRWKP